MKLMRRVRGDVDRLTCPREALRPSEGELEFALKKGERFFEVMTVRRRPSTWGNMHVDQAEAARRVLAGEKDRVGVSDDANVREILIFRLRDCEIALKVVGRERRGGRLVYV